MSVTEPRSRRPEGRESGGATDAQKALSSALALCFRVLQVLLGAAVVLYLGAGVFSVPEGSVALVSVGGRLVREPDGSVRLYRPGVHLTVPPPLGRVQRISVTQVRSLRTEEFFYRVEAQEKLTSLRWRRRTQPLVPGKDGYLLCGDGALLHAELQVDYAVKDPALYFEAFGGDLAKEKQILRLLLCDAAVRAAFSVRLLAEGATGLGGFGRRVRALLSESFSERGLSVKGISLREAKVPPQVEAAFVRRQKAVSEALGERQAALRQAEARRAEAVAKAEALRSEAQREQAEFLSRVEADLHAAGELGASGAAAPASRRQLVLEVLREVLKNATVFTVSGAGGGTEFRLRLLKESTPQGEAARGSEETEK